MGSELVIVKKMIAICQYGGEFETIDDGSMSYVGGEAYALDLDEQTQFSDFKQEIAETLDTGADGLIVKYFLPGNKKNLITVSKDKDFQRMVNYYKDSDQLEIYIIRDGPCTKSTRKKQPPRRPKRAAESSEVVVPLALTTEFPSNEPTNMEIANDMSHIDDPVPLSNSYCLSFPASDGEVRGAAKHWENLITGVGQRFHSLPEFREALRKYSIAHGFNYMYKKNENQRVTVKCKSEGCPWRIHASKLSTTELICIKTMTPTHTCQGVSVKPAFRATRSWVGNLIKEKVKDSPKIKPKEIAEELKRDYGIELNYSQARRAKEFAREQLLGSYKDAYNELPFFCEKIMETNPGSHAKFSTNEDSSFQRLFISFHALVAGFLQGCRPLLFLDSTPLNSRYQGMLLTATAADADDGAFPVAFAVVDDETDDNWVWFLSELKLVIPTSERLTFVSDFQKGLSQSLPGIFGEGYYHAYCLGYLAEKLNNDLTGRFSHEARRLMVQDLYSAANAFKPEVFDKFLEDLKGISPEAYKWVSNSDKEHWANAHFPGARYDHMTSDFGQEFYSWVSEANELPITQLVDELRGKMMQLLYTRRAESYHWVTRLTPSMEEKLKCEIDRARAVQVYDDPFNENCFQVRSSESDEVVDLNNWHCSCRGWLLTGLPCFHAIACIAWVGGSPYDYCSRYFTVESYQLTYAESIIPVPNVERPMENDLNEPAVVVTPPPTIRTPVRTKIRKVEHGRVGPEDFLKRQLQCGKCKGLGHNKRSCKSEGGIEDIVFQ